MPVQNLNLETFEGDTLTVQVKGKTFKVNLSVPLRKALAIQNLGRQLSSEATQDILKEFYSELLSCAVSGEEDGITVDWFMDNLTWQQASALSGRMLSGMFKSPDDEDPKKGKP